MKREGKSHQDRIFSSTWCLFKWIMLCSAGLVKLSGLLLCRITAKWARYNRTILRNRPVSEATTVEPLATTLFLSTVENTHTALCVCVCVFWPKKWGEQKNHQRDEYNTIGRNIKWLWGGINNMTAGCAWSRRGPPAPDGQHMKNDWICSTLQHAAHLLSHVWPHFNTKQTEFVRYW